MTMPVSQAVVRLLPYRVQRHLRLRSRVRLPEQTLVVPMHGETYLRERNLAADWRRGLFARLAADAVGAFVDAGTNLGQTLVDARLAGVRAPYIGFEPNPVCVRYLEELAAANGFEPCTIVSAALGDREGLTSLFTEADSTSDLRATTHPELTPGRARVTHSVAVLRLDTALRSLGVRDVGFVKIDVEGGELDVVRGMEEVFRAARPPILCEVLFADERADPQAVSVRNATLMRLLRAHAYEVAQLVRSPDNRMVRRADRIEAFPDGVWSLETRDLCDYLLVPAERAAELFARAVDA